MGSKLFEVQNDDGFRYWLDPIDPVAATYTEQVPDFMLFISLRGEAAHLPRPSARGNALYVLTAARSSTSWLTPVTVVEAGGSCWSVEVV